MVIREMYPIIVTDNLAECEAFYTKFFGLNAAFKASWFVYLTAPEGGSATIAFMSPDHPSAPPGPEAFGGKGICIEFEVDDATATYERFKALGAAITYPLKDEPFGQRRFGLFDPAGVWVDVLEQIEPAPSFWEPYMTAGQ